MLGCSSLVVGGGATPCPVDDRQHLVEHCSTASAMTAFTALTVLHTGEGRQLGQLKATYVMQTEILNLQYALKIIFCGY